MMTEEPGGMISPQTRERLINGMKRVLGADGRRISHALKVLEFAERILQQEPGNPRIVVPAALLHDIGILRAEAKYGSAEPKYQEIEGPPLAREMFAWWPGEFTAEEIDQICRIIGTHHSARGTLTPEFRIVWDADWLVNLREEYPLDAGVRLTSIISRTFKTQTGRQIAEELYLK